MIICLNILRYITDHIDSLNPSCTQLLIKDYNIFELIINIIDFEPWIRKNKNNNRQSFIDGKWTIINKNEWHRINKTQAQCWLIIYNLFASEIVRTQYKIDNNRKSSFMRLRRHMNEHLIDQIPPLVDLQR